MRWSYEIRRIASDLISSPSLGKGSYGLSNGMPTSLVMSEFVTFRRLP